VILCSCKALLACPLLVLLNLSLMNNYQLLDALLCLPTLHVEATLPPGTFFRNKLRVFQDVKSLPFPQFLILEEAHNLLFLSATNQLQHESKIPGAFQFNLSRLLNLLIGLIYLLVISNQLHRLGDRWNLRVSALLLLVVDIR
jgi:hypothetical protein